MSDAFLALKAHARCKSRLAAYLAHPNTEPQWNQVTANPQCELVQFIQECATKFGPSPEVRLLQSAHATVHSVAMGLAQKRAAGGKFDVVLEFGTQSNYGAASSLLVSAIWKMERKLHSMA